MTVGENLKQADTTFADRARQLEEQEEEEAPHRAAALGRDHDGDDRDDVDEVDGEEEDAVVLVLSAVVVPPEGLCAAP